ERTSERLRIAANQLTSLLRKLFEFSRSYLNEQLYRTKDRGRVWGIYLWLAAAGKGIRGGRATFPESRAATSNCCRQTGAELPTSYCNGWTRTPIGIGRSPRWRVGRGDGTI